MNKRIRFERYEDVRMEYCWTMEEADFAGFLEWMKDGYAKGAEILEKIGFEGLVAYCEGKTAEDITWEEPYFKGDSRTYTQSLNDALVEYLREYAIDAGPVDETYYDDGSDENISVEDFPY